MGHDIDLVHPDGGIASVFPRVSGNWNDMGLTIYDLHGHSGSTISDLIDDYLVEQLEEGLKPLTETEVEEMSKDNKNYWWGCNHAGDECLPKELRLRIYYNYMERWQTTAKRYPDHYWYSDQVWEIKPNKYHTGMKDPRTN